MSASVPPLPPVVLTGVQVGANPIIWSNDDFAELAGDLPLDTILRDMRKASRITRKSSATEKNLGSMLGRAMGSALLASTVPRLCGRDRLK